MIDKMDGKQVERTSETRRHSVNGNGKTERGVRRAAGDIVDLGKTGGVSPPDKEWLSLKDVAQYFSMSIDYARRSWVEWIDQGVNPMRLNGNAKGALRFKKSEIVVLAERWRVQQD